MTNTPTFSVIVTGDIREGFQPSAVTEEFARLFKLPPEKASAVLRGRRALKKEIDGDTADKYRRKLEAIGLVVELEKHEPQEDNFGGLSLEPIEQPRTEAGTVAGVETPEPPSSNIAGCPKCGYEQPRAAIQCEACGFQLDQMSAPSVASAGASAVAPPGGGMKASDDAATASVSREASSPLIDTSDKLTPVVIAAAAGAAFLGALLWKGIAMATGYELGYVAWAIGGGIGVAASVTGARGVGSGVVCAGLALMAILGGKYMVVQEFMDEMTGQLASAEMQEQWQAVYEEDLLDAEIYAEQVYDDETLRAFMVERGYSLAYEADGVTADEVLAFQQEHEDRLKRFGYGDPPAFEGWYQQTIAAEVGEVSTAGIVSENLDWIDIIFLLLGVGTAFRLGQGVNFN